MVGAAGFEPVTPCTPSKCATRLRHAPKVLIRVALPGEGAHGGPRNAASAWPGRRPLVTSPPEGRQVLRPWRAGAPRPVYNRASRAPSRPHAGPVPQERPMKAVRKTAPRPGALEWAEVPVPACGPDEVLLKVRAASLCGTDAHIYNWDPSISGKIAAATDNLARPITVG